MAQTEENNSVPTEYEIIFQQLESSEADDIDLIRAESDEINALRRIIAEISEPENLYAATSHGEPNLVSNVQLSFSS